MIGFRLILTHPISVIEAWAAAGMPESYPAGTWGPESADRMMARSGRVWRRP